MKQNTMKRKMLAGSPAVGAELALGAPLVGEMLSLAGFDFVQVDFQHGMWDDTAAMQAFHHICVGPATPSVRAPHNDYAAIGRLLDRGALTVVVPMVNSAAEAEQAVQAVRYPPQGARSGGAPTGRLTYGDDYLAAANGEVLLMVQIETAAAAGSAEKILAVDGVDGCMIGPHDLGESIGLDASDSADRDRLATTIQAIREGCVRAGKLPGIATGPAGTEQYLKDGFMFVLAVGDYSFVADGARDVLKWVDELRASL
jgi:4-hydroxy-2-oxoheptanedioate aldolase